MERKMNGISDLPSHSSAVEEKLLQKSHAASLNSAWTRPLYLPIPGVRTRRLRVLVPNISFLFPSSSRGGIIIGNPSASMFSPSSASRIMLTKRRRAPLLVVFATLAVFFTFTTLLRNRGSQNWVEEGSSEPSTLVFRKKDLQKIWEWEIESGHYPSHASSTCPPSLLLEIFFSTLVPL